MVPRGRKVGLWAAMLLPSLVCTAHGATREFLGPGAPHLLLQPRLEISPSQGAQGTTVNLTVNVVGPDMGSGPLFLRFEPPTGIQEVGAQRLSNNSLQVQIKIDGTAPIVPRQTRLTDRSGETKIAGPPFTVVPGSGGITSYSTTVSPQVPSVVSVAPSSLTQGQAYTLNLTGQHLQPGVQVSFGEGIQVIGALHILSAESAQVQV